MSEAEARFAAYVAAGPDRIAWLREKTGLPLEPSREALVDLWRWFLAWAEAGGTEEPADGLPMWATPARPEQGEPLRWDDPRARIVASPNPPQISPMTAWVRDAMSYFLVECLRESDPRLGYRLSLEHDRMACFGEPVLVAAGTNMAEYGLPLGHTANAIAPPNEFWEAELRTPDALARFHDQILESAATARPGRRLPPPRTALDLLARRGVDALFDVGRGADGEVVVDIDEELAVVGSAAIDCVAAKLPGAVRTDREVITLPGGDEGAARDAVRMHLLACIAG